MRVLHARACSSAAHRKECSAERHDIRSAVRRCAVPVAALVQHLAHRRAYRRVAARVVVSGARDNRELAQHASTKLEAQALAQQLHLRSARARLANTHTHARARCVAACARTASATCRPCRSMTSSSRCALRLRKISSAPARWATRIASSCSRALRDSSRASAPLPCVRHVTRLVRHARARHHASLHAPPVRLGSLP